MARSKKMFRSAADIIASDRKHLAIMKSTARNMGQDDLARGDNAKSIFSDLCYRFMDGMEMGEDEIEKSVLDEVNFMAKGFTDADVAAEEARPASKGRGR